MTGVDGTALVVGAGLVNHGGQGGLPEQCVWPEDLAKSVPGLLVISLREAEDSASGDPCGSGL